MISRVQLQILLLQGNLVLTRIALACSSLAIAIWALNSTNSYTLFASLVALGMFSDTYSRPFLSVFGDIFRRKRLMIISLLISFVVSMVLCSMIALDIFDILATAICFLVGGIASGLRVPLNSAILSQIAGPDGVGRAFRVQSVVSSTMTLAAPAFAGVLISLFGPPGTAVIATAAFGAAAFSALALRIPDRTLDLDEGTSVLRLWWSGTRAGFEAVYRVQTERWLALFALVINIAMAPFFGVLLPILVTKQMGLSPGWLGAADVAFGIGLVLASSILIGRLNAAVGRHRTIALGFGLLGLCIGLSSSATHAPLLLLCMVIGGIGLSLVNVNTSTLRALATPDSFKTRMFAAVGFVSTAANPLASLAAGPAIEHFGLSPTIMVSGLLIFVLAAAVLYVPQLSTLSHLSDAELGDCYLRLFPKAFAKRVLATPAQSPS